MDENDRERRALYFSNSLDTLWANNCLDRPYVKVSDLEAFERGLRIGAAMGYAGREEMFEYQAGAKDYEQ